MSRKVSIDTESSGAPPPGLKEVSITGRPSPPALQFFKPPKGQVKILDSFPTDVRFPGFVGNSGGLMAGRINQVYGANKTGHTVYGSRVLHREGPKLKSGTKVIWNSPKFGRVVAFISVTSPNWGPWRDLRLVEGIWTSPNSKQYAYSAPFSQLAEYNAITLLADLANAVDYAAIEKRVHDLEDHGDDDCPICVVLRERKKDAQVPG